MSGQAETIQRFELDLASVAARVANPDQLTQPSPSRGDELGES